MRKSRLYILPLACFLTACVAGPGSIQDLNNRETELEKKVDAMSRDMTDIQRRLEIQSARIRNLEQNYSDMYLKMDDLQKKPVVTKPGEAVSADNTAVNATDNTKAPPVGNLYQRANTLYNQGQYLNAILAYQVFIDTYPNDPKVADAYLKQGLSLVKIGRTDGAKFFFKTLIDRFPDSREAALAKQQLDKINAD